MENLRRLRLTRIVYLSPILLYFVNCTEYPIGAIFDKNSEEIQYAFEKQIDFLNSQADVSPIAPEIQVLESTDSFAVSNAICSLLKKGVYGIIGVSDASALSTIQSYSNTFKVPFIALSRIQNSSNHGDFQLFMRPVYINGLLDVIIKYGWDRLLYIYDTDEGLIRLQQLFQAVNAKEHMIDIDVKRVSDTQGCYTMLKGLHRKDDKANIRVFLDIPTEKAEDVIVMLKNDSQVMNYKFHFLLGELRIEEMDTKPFSNGGINITGFQLLNYTSLKKNAPDREWRKWAWPDEKNSDKIPLEPALVIDAVDLFQRALKQIYKNRHNGYNVVAKKINMKNVKCTDNSYVSPNNGTHMMEKLKGKEVQFNGLTGKVSFDENGFRNNFKLHLLDITMNMGLAEVGSWTRESGLVSQEPSRRRHGVEQKNRTRIVTTILEPPYVMYKDEATKMLKPHCGREHFKGFCIDMADEVEKIVNVKFNICLRLDNVYGEQKEDGTWNGMLGQLVRQDNPYMMYKDDETKSNEPMCGKEHFIGFCADLAAAVAEQVGFDYDICIVKDKKYGELLQNGTWNGMIGELTRDEVDLAIAPMTITSQRERVVDFTKPYMSLGISIMIKKTAVKKASVFSFMDPLSYEIWMCILFAYIGVSVVLFLVSRFSPTEWHVDDGASITNDFTISNSLWYSLGAFMQQGCDISPRSVSGRIVGSVWWFFTLIIISSYTANLAAFLTVERMLTPIESAEDLAKQTEIQYGILSSGSTKSFFQQSKFPVHERMWAYMQSASPSVFVKTNDDGIARVRKGNYAYLMESTTNKYNNMRKPCDTMQVGPNLDSKGYGIATPIGSDLRDPLTLAVLKLREAGKLEEMQKEWWEKRSECPKKENNQDGGQAELTLENVAGIFYILAAGLSLSVIIAFFEFVYKSKIDSKRSKKSFGSVLRCKARLSFRGSLDRDTHAPSTPLRKSMSTYTYTGPSHVAGADGFPDNLHTQV